MAKPPRIAEKRWLGMLAELGAIDSSRAVSTAQIQEHRGGESINTEALQRLRFEGKVGYRLTEKRVAWWHIKPRGLASMDWEQKF